jgi:methionyl-tRNA formyltransferase
VLDRFGDGTAVETPQDDGAATYAHRLRKEEGLIDWRAAASSIHDQVRGLQPWPMAWTSFDGRRLIVIRSRVARGEAGAGGLPGTIVGVGKDAVRIQTGAGHLDILTVQPEGRRAMPARDFAAGHLAGRAARFDPGPAEPAG